VQSKTYIWILLSCRSMHWLLLHIVTKIYLLGWGLLLTLHCGQNEHHHDEHSNEYQLDGTKYVFELSEPLPCVSVYFASR
jgi:hypothetical protein